MSPNHAYSNRLSQMAASKSNYDRILPPDDETDLSVSEMEMLQELKFEGILDARESRERGDW